MATQDDFIKTALRLPRELHAAIRLAAESGGKSMNAEIIGRLQDSLKPAEAATILARLNTREAELLEANRQQLDLLRGIVRRADVVMEAAWPILNAASQTDGAARLLQEIAVCRELIRAVDPRQP
ncbi:Arc family DNA-binding protein [Burkholderia sp. BCC1985]|uniref:Arc family DNA-binding protein n=1 Tax=Burkholderia sp. BCC1985 TaxID=2817442 RepID=UPI002AB2015A|nr:Arc family DNA-binding protein [Burkholderia sp. BCC1985]